MPGFFFLFWADQSIPMMTRYILPVLCTLMLSLHSLAQTDTEKASTKAIAVANSLVKAFNYSEWDQYLALSYPGVVKYYGGRNGYLNYVQKARSMYKDSIQESPETLRIIQIENDILEWQCVVEKTRETFLNGRKARAVSYLVGQSKDDGQTWKFFDVAHNSVENVIYIMPDIFSNLAIPQKAVHVESDYGYDQQQGSGSTKSAKKGNSLKQ